MKIPKGFRKVDNPNSSIEIIMDDYGNEYLLVPEKDGEQSFWISRYEISKNDYSKISYVHPAWSLPNKSPWLFISLDEARMIAQKQGGRIPTEREYERFYQWSKENHLDKEEKFIWTDSKYDDQKHYITRQGKCRQICHFARKCNLITFRIVLN